MRGTPWSLLISWMRGWLPRCGRGSRRVRLSSLILVVWPAWACSPEPLRRDVCAVIGSGIVNGTPCDALKGPVVEVTAVFEGRAREQRQACTGTLISDRFILTAAHCFDPPGSTTANRVEVVIEGQRLTSSWFVSHPDATFQRVPELGVDQAVGINDIALIRLDTPVSTKPLAIGGTSGVMPGDALTVAGFGFDENGKRGALKAGQLRVARVLTGQLVSAVDPSGATTCFGDSGGPAIADLMGVPTVVGVASSAVAFSELESGAECRDLAAVFINLGSAPVARFIEGVLANNRAP